MAQKVGFIGLGHLGRAMAKHLLDEGVELVVWNRTPQKAADLGAEVAKSPADLAGKVSVIILNLFDSAAVEAVLTASDGLLMEGLQGKVLVDTTTNHFASVGSFYDMVKERGGSYLEAPVLGSVVPASQGNLTVVTSGDASAHETVLPILEKIGKKVFYLGPTSLATKMKLVNNLVLGNFMAVLAEAVSFGEAIGLSRKEVIDVLDAGAGNSLVLNAKKGKLLEEDFSPHFSAALIYKDMHYMQDLARTLKRPLFTCGMAKELFGMAFPKGLEGEDFAVVYRVLKEL